MMFKIVANNQNSLDEFNKYFGTDYKNGQKLNDDEVDNQTLGKFNVKYAISGYNKAVSQREIYG